MTQLRIATVAAEDDALRWARSIALRAGADVAVAVDARDGRGLAERAALLRARDVAMLLLVGRSGAARLIAEVVGAARVAATDAEAPPRLLAAAHPDVAGRAQAAAAGLLALGRAPHPSSDEGDAAVAQLRARRGAAALDALEARVRDLDEEDVLACEVDEGGARLAVGSHARVLGVELAGIGVGAAGDALARRVGARAIRRWLPAEPLPDAAGLRDRIANLSRFGPTGAAADALRLALLREALGAVVAAARRDIESAALERPRRVLLGGAFLALRPGEAVGALLDVLGPQGGARVRIGDRAVALVVGEAPRRAGVTLRITDDRGDREERIASGALAVLPTAGAVTVRSGRRVLVEEGEAGELGLLVDARTRPLALPERDAERTALLASWTRALAAAR